MSAYDQLIGALEGSVKVAQSRDGSARAQCPSHNSRGMSLLVSRRDDGAGLHCFGGCETADVLASVGLSMRDLFDDNDTDWKHRRTWTPRPAPSPIGDPAHWCDRAMQQELLDADPDRQARLAAELTAASAPRPGDFEGVGHA